VLACKNASIKWLVACIHIKLNSVETYELQLRFIVATWNVCSYKIGRAHVW
jgi:hypothetical protein